jgi:VWFA-related protein
MEEYTADNIKSLYWTALTGLACLGLGMAQSIPRDEIHSRTITYVPPSLATLRTEVRVVEVPVVVRDRQHRTVAGLIRDDFNVYDDGKKQAITDFSVQGSAPQGDTNAAGGDGAVASKDQPRPRFLALCFDDLHLDPASLTYVKDSAERFVRAGLAPGDRVAVVTTSLSLDSEFIGDVATLVELIAKVTATPPRISGDVVGCPRISPYDAYQIANQMDPGNQVLNAKMAECAACTHLKECTAEEVMFKAEATWQRTRSNTVNTLSVIDGLVDGMAKLPGQRIILLTSSGFLTGTLEADVDRLMDKARKAEVVINSCRWTVPQPLGERGYRGLGGSGLGHGRLLLPQQPSGAGLPGIGYAAGNNVRAQLCAPAGGIRWAFSQAESATCWR